MKMGVETPTRLVDITRLALAKVEELPDGKGVRIGALVRNSDLAEHPLIVERYPVLSQALLAGASPQLRNMATTGGNLLQRTRCYYFYDPAFPRATSASPAAAAARWKATTGSTRSWGPATQCIATHPSDMCVAMAALDAVVRVQGPKGEREIRFAEFHRLPGEHPEHDTNLQPDEIITAIDLPAPPWAKTSHYLKVRDRASYAFALVSVAAALEVEAARSRPRGLPWAAWRTNPGARKKRRRSSSAQSRTKPLSKPPPKLPSSTRRATSTTPSRSNWPSAHRPRAVECDGA